MSCETTCGSRITRFLGLFGQRGGLLVALIFLLAQACGSSTTHTPSPDQDSSPETDTPETDVTPKDSVDDDSLDNDINKPDDDLVQSDKTSPDTSKDDGTEEDAVDDDGVQPDTMADTTQTDVSADTDAVPSDTTPADAQDDTSPTDTVQTDEASSDTDEPDSVSTDGDGTDGDGGLLDGDGGTDLVEPDVCDTCQDSAICTPDDEDAPCICPAGYQGDGTLAGTGCTDVDECAEGIDGCMDAPGTCSNVGGSYICDCEFGFQGDGLIAGLGCFDLDECQAGTDACLDDPGVCTNVLGSYLCDCKFGFEGDGFVGGTGCVDVDECKDGLDDCVEAPGTCTNIVGGYTCGCETGFEGDGVVGGSECTDVDECAAGLDDCLDAPGTCTNNIGGFYCGCEDGYEGDGVPVELGGAGCVLQNPRLTVPTRMINDKPLTLRAQILDATAHVDPSGCYDDLGTVSMTRLADGQDIPLTVTVFDDHLPIPEDSVRFYHGVGSVSFTLDDGANVPAGEYQVMVTINGLTARKLVTIEANPTWRVMPATLTGDNLVWGPNENIRISEHFTDVPVGSTLVIHPGTLVMVDTTGALEDGTLINVNGRMEAVGRLGSPIAFFSEKGPAAMTHTVSDSLSNVNAWRGFNFWGSDSSVLRWVMLTGAGNGIVISHPRPPILNIRDTHNLLVEDSVFTDATGMVFQSPGTGSNIIRRCLVSRVGIGAEFLSSGHTLLIEDTWWTGIGRGPNTPIRFDGDGIHVDGLNSDQTIRRCIVADIGDDGLDHSNSTFALEDVVIHDVKDKAMSMTAGLGVFVNVLIYNAGSGIRGTAHVYNSTVVNTPSPIVVPQIVQSTILWPQSIYTCNGDIDYTLLGSAADLACGDGNFSMDPYFVDPANCDYRVAADSPAATAGPDGDLIGWPGYPVYNP